MTSFFSSSCHSNLHPNHYFSFWISRSIIHQNYGHMQGPPATNDWYIPTIFPLLSPSLIVVDSMQDMLGNGVPWEHAPCVHDILQYTLFLSVWLATEERWPLWPPATNDWYVSNSVAIVSHLLIVINRMWDTPPTLACWAILWYSVPWEHIRVTSFNTPWKNGSEDIWYPSFLSVWLAPPLLPSEAVSHRLLPMSDTSLFYPFPVIHSPPFCLDRPGPRSRMAWQEWHGKNCGGSKVHGILIFHFLGAVFQSW